MEWTPNPDTEPTARIAATLSSLQPTERRVAEAVLAERAATVEMAAQQLADHVGVSRASVIRTAQKLGYQGFPQLRVALAQEIARGEFTSSDERAPAGPDTSMVMALRRETDRFAERLRQSMAALDDRSLVATVKALDSAQRVLIVANGFSAPLGLDLGQRLISAGRSAEYHPDVMSQRIAAHHLGEGSVCVVYSGSGANSNSVQAAESARRSGAQVIVLTSFSRSALASLADLLLVVPPTNSSFQDELINTSRAALMVLTEELVKLFIAYRGDSGAKARDSVLTMIADSLKE